MITEYRDTYAEYMWRSVSPDILLNESYLDEKLREAVGEEKLIMHSMLTGQNFILERQ